MDTTKLISVFLLITVGCATTVDDYEVQATVIQDIESEPAIPQPETEAVVCEAKETEVYEIWELTMSEWKKVHSFDEEACDASYCSLKIDYGIDWDDLEDICGGWEYLACTFPSGEVYVGEYDGWRQPYNLAHEFLHVLELCNDTGADESRTHSDSKTWRESTGDGSVEDILRSFIAENY